MKSLLLPGLIFCSQECEYPRSGHLLLGACQEVFDSIVMVCECVYHATLAYKTRLHVRPRVESSNSAHFPLIQGVPYRTPS